MCGTCERKATEAPADKHLWEVQGLGQSPFRLFGCFVKSSTCDSCGTPIKYNFMIESADGSKFVVGSTCVEKTGDRGLYRTVMERRKSLEREVRIASKKAKYEAVAAANMVEGVRGLVELEGKPAFESPLTDLEAIEAMENLKGDFPLSLYQSFHTGHPKYGRGLTSKQWKWVHKLAYDAANRPAAKVAHIGSDDQLTELFSKAKVKYPKLTFETPDGRTLQLSRAGDRAKFPGSINVTDGRRYGENIWYGRIVDGEFRLSRDADDEVTDFLTALAKDPKGFAKAYGVKTGNCCFCNAKLTTDDSNAVGYGPVCAKNWGLPWGKAATKAATTEV